jgi:hypothetical protein
MKRVLLLLLFIPGLTFGQKITFKSLRYDEDYSFLAKDTSDNWYHKLKFMPLNNGSYLSFGGEFRSQYFNYVNPDWGDAPKDADGFVLARYLLHADLHVGKYFRTFVQLQSSLSNGEAETPSAVNENPLDLHQAFIDVKLPLNNNGALTLRLGRQELQYGSQRLISVREAPNNRQAFDAAKILYTSKNIKLDAFFSHYVQASNGIFDDKPTTNTKFWGSYATIINLPLIHNADFYYFGIRKRSAVFDDGKGRELRHSVGFRTWKSGKTWQYDIEGLYQFGDFMAKDISAWTISLNLSHSWAVKLDPKLGIKTEVISGDKQFGDDKLNTFNPLFPRGGYFGLAALIGPSNLFDFHPYLELSIAKGLLWTTDYDLFYRLSLNDGIYAVNGKLIYSGKGTSSRSIGGQIGSSLEYTPIANLYCRAEINWFRSGNYLKEAGSGQNILMSGATITFKF